MTKLIKIFKVDKENIKMINQKETGFSLVIHGDGKLRQILEEINSYEENGDDISIVWQMKHKHDSFTVYRKCKFSAPTDNFFAKPFDRKPKPFGKRIDVECGGSTIYTNGHPSTIHGAKPKSGKLLERMLKIDELGKVN